MNEQRAIKTLERWRDDAVPFVRGFRNMLEASLAKPVPPEIPEEEAAAKRKQARIAMQNADRLIEAAEEQKLRKGGGG